MKFRSPQALLVNRMMVDQVVEAPNGAHFTNADPDYKRDREVPATLRGGGCRGRDLAGVRRHLSVGSEADYQAAVRRFAEEEANDPGQSRRGCASSPARKLFRECRGDHGQPDDETSSRSAPDGAADLRAGHPAHRR